LVDRIPGEVRVFRTFPGLFYHFTFRYSPEGRSGDGAGAPSANAGLTRILADLHLKVCRMLNRLLVPDIYAEWLPFALPAGLRLLRKYPYDVIISSSEPRTCHVVAYLLKKQGDLPWIADYGDPWVYPLSSSPDGPLKKRLLRTVERRMLHSADGVTVTAEGTRDLYLRDYPFLNGDTVHLVTQGFDPGAFVEPANPRNRKFTIVYCGSFYERLRDPMPFLEAVAGFRSEDIEVIVAGRINRFADTLREAPYRGRVVFLGFLPHRESLALQKRADLLLHIGNATDVQVPGKIYEYLGARRPILAIEGGGSDPSSALIHRYNRGIVVRNEKEDIAQGLTTLYRQWKEGTLDARFDLGDIHDYTWERSAGVMNRILEKL
jgi:glycosyltransferase involved in cell wall biosynthesis